MSDETEEQKSQDEYHPAQYLSVKVIDLCHRIVMFPNISEREHALTAGYAYSVASNGSWKNHHARALIALLKKEYSQKTIEVAAARRAHIMDKLTEDLMPRFDAPETDPAKLEAILGSDYTNKDKERYEARFVQSMPAKDAVRLWLQLDKNVTESAAASQKNEEPDDVIVGRIRDRHRELQSVENRMKKFASGSMFDFSSNIHDGAVGPIGVIDVEIVEDPSQEEE